MGTRRGATQLSLSERTEDGGGDSMGGLHSGLPWDGLRLSGVHRVCTLSYPLSFLPLSLRGRQTCTAVWERPTCSLSLYLSQVSSIISRP